jgi:hypothetical protein
MIIMQLYRLYICYPIVGYIYAILLILESLLAPQLRPFHYQKKKPFK